MKSKWEWVSEKCLEINNKKAAEIADKIENILQELYPKIPTDKWKEDYNSINKLYNKLSYVESKSNFIVNKVIIMGEYCIACDIESKGCDNCLFAHKSGGRCPCDDKGLFNDFLKEMNY